MKKNRIGFDARMWDHPGIGRYIRELSKRLVHLNPGHELTFYGYRDLKDQIYAKVTGDAGGESSSARSEELHEHGRVPCLAGRQAQAAGPVTFVKTRSKIYGALEQLEIPRLARGADLLHVPHFNIPVFPPKKLVVTVHDLTYLRDPFVAKSPLAKFYAQFLFRMIARKAAAILTVSEYTKNDLLSFFPQIHGDRVTVTPEAVSGFFKKIDDAALLENARKKFSVTRPILLFVGSLRSHKNIPELIRAFSNLRAKEGLSHELILIGRSDEKSSDILRLVSETAQVRYLGELSDEDIRAFYSLAEVFVLPSLREGFGLPVLEAMACGAPVIVSNRTSLPEVAGEAGMLFEPGKVDALEEVLYTVLKNKELRQKMSQAGLERVKRFSWENTARKTLEVYDKVLAG